MAALNNNIISSLITKATESIRHRMNYNIHESIEDSVQRMFHAIEPESEFPITRHPNASETLIAIRGRLQITIYNEQKDVIDKVTIAPMSDNIGYHIPSGTWHRVNSLKHGTVVFETREGPYSPVAEEDILR